jgi:hypothetical protein
LLLTSLPVGRAVVGKQKQPHSLIDFTLAGGGCR